MGRYLDIAKKFQASRQGQLRECPIPVERARSFLPRPLGQEEVNPCLAWENLLAWLKTHHPQHFRAICDAEDEIQVLEQQGITGGPQYEQACHQLLTVLEAGRRLKMAYGFKIWIQ